ncbi:uncharacterized protein E0L32_010750 [Thyridium curvatum]|uniref:Sodium/calcium exchanger membrane region domain-containing protein n=1 Tax=Thyridium curvatum TaxID=1093900 RepID=A0A507AR23_9PEZI|nr:uncharacterized protein E0L32_010750 [Thyridium curvatum]TPX07328.1 hypothetical protein E0L32_010750 [Thyridium curvatum]
MEAPVSHYHIKRQAHTLSRQETDARFSPFAHIQWRKKNNRSETFPRDVEAQRQVDRDETQDVGSPIEHAQTAPTSYLSGANNDIHAEQLERSKEEDVPDPTGSSGGQYSGETELNDHLTPTNTTSGMRKRGVAGSSASPTGEARENAEDEKKGKKKKDHRLFKHVEPKEPFTVGNQLQRTFLNSWINILLFAAPVGIGLHFTSVDPVAIFVVNFVAIVPLAAMLSFATEEIALRTGETLGGLLNATFGNAVELIVAVMALVKKQIVIVQTSLIGSILSNLLLVMGMCFFFGGLRRQEQFFNTTVAQTAASLLALAVAGVIVPTVFDVASITSVADVAALSRGTSIILLFVYGGYLFFQLKTHQAVFAEESQKVPAKPFKHSKDIKQGLANPVGLIAHGVSGHEDNQRLSRMLMQPPIDEEEGEEPQLHFFVALGLLTGSTVVIAFCAEFLVDSIDDVTTRGHISKEFLGLILLPIVGNAAEHATAVTVAIKDKMDLAIGVAIGSSMQVALFIIPLLVVIGWGMGLDDMSLSFDIFQVAVLFVSVLLVNYLIADGKSHWLEGMLLMCLYCIIAVCSWWYPAKESASE